MCACERERETETETETDRDEAREVTGLNHKGHGKDLGFYSESHEEP